MAFKYQNYYYKYPGSVKIDAALPLDIRTVVSTLDDLYGNTARADETWKQAYNGLIVAVIDPNTRDVYMCIDSANPYTPNSWKKISSPDVQISGHMVDVVEFGGDETYEPGFYDKTDGEGEGDSWHPTKQGAKPITDSTVTEAGKYLCLEVGEDKVYINSKDLIDLDGYVTKEELDASLQDIKISYTLTSNSEYVDTSVSIDETGRIIDASVDLVTASMLDASNGIDGLATAVDVYNEIQKAKGNVQWEDEINNDELENSNNSENNSSDQTNIPFNSDDPIEPGS